MNDTEKAAAIIKVTNRINSGESPPPEFPRVNAYICEACGCVRHTVDAAAGTTPMVIPCIASDATVIELVDGAKASRCNGHMKSAWYSVMPGDVDLKDIEYEWRSPSLETYKQMKKANSPVADHVAKGGLILHKRTNKDSPMLTHGDFHVRPDGTRLTEDEEASMLSGLEKLRAFIRIELTLAKREFNEKQKVKRSARAESRKKRKLANAARRRNR